MHQSNRLWPNFAEPFIPLSYHFSNDTFLSYVENQAMNCLVFVFPHVSLCVPVIFIIELTSLCWWAVDLFTHYTSGLPRLCWRINLSRWMITSTYNLHWTSKLIPVKPYKHSPTKTLVKYTHFLILKQPLALIFTYGLLTCRSKPDKAITCSLYK